MCNPWMIDHPFLYLRNGAHNYLKMEMNEVENLKNQNISKRNIQ